MKLIHRNTIIGIAAILTVQFLPYVAHADKRVALVVGINTYDNLGLDRQLKKAVADARAISDTFDKLGFEVTRIEDVHRSDFSRQWQRFVNSLAPGDTAALFFSGHGVQIGGLNYLLPRDVPKLGPNEEGLLRDESIAMQKMLDDLKGRSPRLSLVIVDACRDNPFPLPGGKSVGGTRGLARVDPPEGTFVMFSAGAGETALDRLPGNDTEPTSVYTRSLVPLLRKPGLTLPDVAQRVRRDVLDLAAAIGHKQTPAYWDELSGAPVCLAGGCRDLSVEPTKPATPPKSSPPINPAAEEWSRLDKSSAAELEVFTRRHGASPEAAYARARLEELRKLAMRKPATPADPPVAKSGPVMAESKSLRAVVRQGKRSGQAVSIAVEITNISDNRLGLAVAHEAASTTPLLGDDGTVCKPQRFIGLPALQDDEVAAYQPFAGGGWVHQQKQTLVSAGQTVNVTFYFACPGSTQPTSAQLTVPLHTFRGPGQAASGSLTLSSIPIGGR